MKMGPGSALSYERRGEPRLLVIRLGDQVVRDQLVGEQGSLEIVVIAQHQPPSEMQWAVEAVPSTAHWPVFSHGELD